MSIDFTIPRAEYEQRRDAFELCAWINSKLEALEVEITGVVARSFKLEVTTSETNESTMRRQALARDGMVNLTGPVHREGRQIVSDGEMVDAAEEESRTIERLLERLKEKVASNRYDDQTAILSTRASSASSAWTPERI